MAKTMTPQKATEKLWHSIDAVEVDFFKDTEDHYLLLEGGLDSEIQEKVLEINPQNKTDWVYEGTDLDNEKENGPLVVKLDFSTESGLALFEVFHTTWVKSHLGIIISTPKAYSSREIKEHLQQLRYVKMADTPAEQKVLFRWYEPRSLLGLLEVFSSNETKILLGTIRQIIWCEWTYDQGSWYQLQAIEHNEKPVEKTLKIKEKTSKALDDYSFEYFLKCLTRELISKGKKPDKYSETEMLNAVRKHCNDAYSKGFSHEDDVKQYINLYLQNMLEIEKNKVLQNILTDKSIPAWQRLQVIKKHIEQIGTPL